MRRKLEGISNTVMVIFMIVFMVFCVFYVYMETNKEEPETVMTEEEQLQTETEAEISPSITIEIHSKIDYDYNKYWELVRDSVEVDLGEYYAASSTTYDEDNYYALISYTSSTETHKYWVSVFVKEDGTVYDINIEGWEL